MTTVYAAKERVDIGIGATKVIDVSVVNDARSWAFIDVPRHPDKHSIDFTDLGNGKMQITNNSRWVVSLWPAQPFLGRKEYKKATIVASVTDVNLGTSIDVLDLDARLKGLLRDNGVYTANALGRIKYEHLLTFKGVGPYTAQRIMDAYSEWEENDEGTGTE